MICLSNVSKSYQTGNVSVNVLHGVDLNIQAGEFVAIMGPSGSGKSILLNLIACLDVIDGGEYRFSDMSVGSLNSDGLAQLRRQRIGFVFQNFNLITQFSTLRNVELPLIYAGMDKIWSIIGIVAASISLLVGGMGIMNMMGTSVLERTREIGVRKAIGATERDILLQFLLEAGLISITGGVLGLLIGGLASVALATGFPVMPSIVSIAGALGVSIVVGVLSGYLPARRAAKMKPVDALNTN